MSQVKSCNTRPEMVVRSLLHRMGYRFRLHLKDIPGKPDIVLPRHHKVIFVHGCFWHGHKGCARAARPSSNREFCDKILSRNAERDKSNLKMLAGLGWKTLVVWQCELKSLDVLSERLRCFIES